MKDSSVVIYSDGGSRGNPGPGACAYLIFDKDKVLKKDSKFLGRSTNNVAEYNGALFAIEGLIDLAKVYPDLKKEKIVFKMDSELVVKQLGGFYKIKDKNLMELSMKIRDLIKVNGLDINFTHVPRKENYLADKMVNEKLDDSSRR